LITGDVIVYVEVGGVRTGLGLEMETEGESYEKREEQYFEHFE
jgi:hypothetical protein